MNLIVKDSDAIIKLGEARPINLEVSDKKTVINIRNTVGDKHFEKAFINTNQVDVVHNMQKFPSVTVIDSAKREFEGLVEYIDNNHLVVRFNFSFSGIVICN